MTASTRFPYLPIAAAILVAGCIAQALFGYTHEDLSGHAMGTDDAFISYRYACNLANGDGLTFNPGERVEGYSNFSYVLLMSGACLIAEGFVFPLSVLLNTLFSLAALLVFHALVRDKLGRERAIAAAFLFAAAPTVWCWAAAGLETSLILLLQVAILAVVERSSGTGEPIRTGLLAGLLAVLVFSRVDGFLIPMLVVAFLFATGRTRPALICLVATLAALSAHLGFRWSYYHDVLPNTFYVKVSGPLSDRIPRGVGQIINLGIFQGLGVYWIAVAISAIALIARPPREWRAALERVGFAPLLAVCWIAYFIYIGGDVYQERFLLLFYPLGAYLMLRLTVGRPLALVRSLVAIVLTLQVFTFAEDPRFGWTTNRYDRWVELGRFLGEHHRGEMVAVDAAGKIPYFSGLVTLDMYGLNDRTIAKRKPEQDGKVFNPGHGKFDAAYVLSKRPDLIAGWIDTGLDATGGMLREVYEPAGFQVLYLVNARGEPREPNIIDVSDSSEAEIVALIEADYRYGVLARRR